jgi:hypothetical protein
MTTKMRGSFGGEKKYAHNSHAGGSTSGTEIARYLHVLHMYVDLHAVPSKNFRQNTQMHTHAPCI